MNSVDNISSFTPSLSEECFRAWKTNGKMDLREEAAPDIETFRGRADRLRGLHERRVAGDPIDLENEAPTFGLTPERLDATLAAWGRSTAKQGATL